MAKATSVLLLALGLAGGGAARTETVAIVLCAPGYPGSTLEAQPAMDAFAAAVGEAAGWGKGAVTAVYHETEAAGLARLARPDASAALVPLPFFLEHEVRLKLRPRLQAVPKGAEPSEVWSLVAGRGKVASAAGLDGWELLSLAAYAPRFVRGPALAGWGVLPGGTRLVHSGAVLSGLRRAASGEKVALLLDRAQTTALATLPFGPDLEVVTRSAPLPGSVLATVSDRLPEARARPLAKALLGLGRRPAEAEALAALRLARFVALDEAGLRRAREAFQKAP